jgi:hypothetical protein
MNIVKNVLSAIIFIAIASPAFAETEVFKLYRERNQQIDAFCDQYTELKLTSNGFRATAVLTPKVQGACEVLPRGQARTYLLKFKDDGCGSKVFRSLNNFDGEEIPEEHSAPLEITDNRGRLCENVIPALIVVKEIVGGDVVVNMYSQDQR